MQRAILTVMTSVAFDTLQAARSLQKAGMNREHAEAIAQVAGLRGEDSATKGHLSALEARIESKIESKVEQAKNSILRAILTGSIAIVVTMIGGIFTLFAAG